MLIFFSKNRDTGTGDKIKVRSWPKTLATQNRDAKFKINPGLASKVLKMDAYR